MDNTNITFNPKWDENSDTCSQLLARLGVSLGEVNLSHLSDPDNQLLYDISEEFFRDVTAHVKPNRSHQIEAAGSILFDLVKQGWGITVEGDVVTVCSNISTESVQEEKSRVRAQELIKRDEQLKIPSVRRFVEQMESSRLYVDKFISIFSLMRDGKELSTLIQKSREQDNITQQLSQIIMPYIQVIDSDQDKCEFTGLKLSDIWRYFRYTWANQANPIPGRSMRFLVRDAATEYHTIMGIGALGSPIVALSSRDVDIGWDFKAFLQKCKSMPYTQLFQWIQKIKEGQLNETYIEDLLEKNIITRNDISTPDYPVIERLIKQSEIARETHRAHGTSQEYKKRLRTNLDCEERSRRELFKSKRCDRLASLLRIQKFLNDVSDLPEEESQQRLLNTKEGKWVITTTIKLRKSAVIGIDVADITVCGAIPPYNALVVGKLIGSLCASPQVITAYNQRYRGKVSEIASGMAGRVVIRPPGLALLGTTSLYGSNSSQYNRL